MKQFIWHFINYFHSTVKGNILRRIRIRMSEIGNDLSWNCTYDLRVRPNIDVYYYAQKKAIHKYIKLVLLRYLIILREPYMKDGVNTHNPRLDLKNPICA